MDEFLKAQAHRSYWQTLMQFYCFDSTFTHRMGYLATGMLKKKTHTDMQQIQKLIKSFTAWSAVSFGLNILLNLLQAAVSLCLLLALNLDLNKGLYVHVTHPQPHVLITYSLPGGTKLTSLYLLLFEAHIVFHLEEVLLYIPGYLWAKAALHKIVSCRWRGNPDTKQQG